MTRGAGWGWKVGDAMPGHSYKRAYFAFARYLSPSSGPVNARVVAALVTYRPSLLTEEAVVGVAGFPRGASATARRDSSMLGASVLSEAGATEVSNSECAAALGVARGTGWWTVGMWN